jgi:CheY-like chemotaxis protein
MILIVDDSSTDIELTTLALEATGREISIRSEKEGESAIAMLCNEHMSPELILLDMKMPGMDGIEVLGALECAALLQEIRSSR